jgi:hypothetical protein
MERVFPHGVIGASYAGWESTILILTIVTNL